MAMNNLVYAGNATSSDGAAHIHNGLEVICFAQYGEIEANGRTYTLSENCVALIPPRVRHSTRYADGNFRAIVEQSLVPIRDVKVIKPPYAEGITEAIKRAAAICLATDAEKEILLPALGNLIASFAAAYGGGNGFSPVVLQIMADIDKHIGDAGYSLESFIRTLPLNYDYVRKVFAKETDITPHEYLIRSRMDRARDIILSGASNKYSDFTISQISEACGYAEPLYFSRVFKKYFGVSPSAYTDSLRRKIIRSKNK